ncbi:MAG: hypothetical protein AVDCRST_MAG59-482, partial [uncultured Thermomicrobiales bacterium]
ERRPGASSGAGSSERGPEDAAVHRDRRAHQDAGRVRARRRLGGRRAGSAAIGRPGPGRRADARVVGRRCRRRDLVGL